MANHHENIPQRPPATPAAPAGPVLEWKSHPASRRPMITVAVSVFVLICAGLVFSLTASKAFATLALLVLFASLAKYYFPTRFRLDADGVTVKTMTQTLHKAWSMYRSYYPDRNGVLLSPFPSPSRLENFRGLYLMFAGNGDEVVQFVGDHISKTSAEDGEKDPPA